jgi:3-hydroxyisobutyrate dehydrogenase-like beta-hydroxyacid dehydrogenase
MIVGFVGVGEMGKLMAGHIASAGHEIHANDVNPANVEAAVAYGAKPAARISDLPAATEVFIVMVHTDDQAEDVTLQICEGRRKGSVIAVSGTHRPATMKSLGAVAAHHGLGLVDCPVVYGVDGARAGRLLSLCGGDRQDIEKIRPVLQCYSRDVLHVGPLGAGQIAKTCNNLLHWQHAVGNYEALLLAKRYGLDPQKLREVLLQSPGTNGTLERFDEARFTWQEKDMDVVMELAQASGLVLPLSGQVDQLIKLLKPKDVHALLYEGETTYLGRKVVPLAPEEGGLG